ncbi:hypothetical protein ASPSYDRAFT_86568 [Aspergillus sydowii CBS 593.65]|uniref:Uncharacterized protein n=1 Tax=Aspergillus sydowii CBS 593.65 TaxID=1036612 RepID=A0A1L9TU87_9EURO|nr:uncharacterized protein ASPSYDRAFT_86568 [Aspergillus sydowii CBS 593.65]OJJ62918.1 hypothetical protein ASPSYDRAFT_86568 [Aspergillus sydowii CBS 593.65]
MGLVYCPVTSGVLSRVGTASVRPALGRDPSLAFCFEAEPSCVVDRTKDVSLVERCRRVLGHAAYMANQMPQPFCLAVSHLPEWDGEDPATRWVGYARRLDLERMPSDDGKDMKMQLPRNQRVVSSDCNGPIEHGMDVTLEPTVRPDSKDQKLRVPTHSRSVMQFQQLEVEPVP